jgi:uncharacterized protein with NRDE domain
VCSIILRIDAAGVFIAANRDEMVNRPWSPPAAWWPDQPDVIAGRDETAGGTWLGINGHGVMAAVLNRHGSLGPAPGKRSRGELPLIALRAATAQDAAKQIAALDASTYRSFNLVTADSTGAYFAAALETGRPKIRKLEAGTWMITSGEPNDLAQPRIARHLPKFEAAAFEDWPKLLADSTGPWESALNIPERNGFGTVSAAVIALPKDGAARWEFCAGAPDSKAYLPVSLADR